MVSPPVFLIPANPTDDLSLSLKENEKHFISRKDFETWAKAHPSIRPATGPTTADGTQSKGYR